MPRAFGPDPEDVVTPVPPLRTARTPEVMSAADQLVFTVAISTLLICGLPERFGVVLNTTLPVPVFVVTPVPPRRTARVPAVISAAFQFVFSVAIFTLLICGVPEKFGLANFAYRDNGASAAVVVHPQ